MRDADFMLAVLEDGPASTMDLIRRSINERGCGLTPHSRASELRAQGHTIVCTREGEHNGRGIYVYHLLWRTSNETDAACAEGATGASVSLGVPESSGFEPRLGRESEDAAAVASSSDPVQLSLLAVA